MIAGVVNGATPAMDRPQFVKLVVKLEEGNCLVVTMIDRLGRDNIDVQLTITMLLDMGVKLLCLDLTAKNLSKAEGKVLGHPIAKNTTKAVQEHKIRRLSQSQVAKVLGLSIMTVSRHWCRKG